MAAPRRILVPMRRAAARHLVDDVDRVAAAHEILRPAFSAVRRAGEIGAGLVAAVHHHDRIRRAHLLRDHVFDVHVADDRAALRLGVDVAADIEIARALEHQRPALLLLLLRLRGRHRQQARHPHDDRGPQSGTKHCCIDHARHRSSSRAGRTLIVGAGVHVVVMHPVQAGAVLVRTIGPSAGKSRCA